MKRAMARAARAMDGDKEGGQARATSWAMVMATRVAGNKEGDCIGSKGGGNNDKEGHSYGNSMGDGDGN
jgi:hypothetical protein